MNHDNDRKLLSLFCLAVLVAVSIRLGAQEMIDVAAYAASLAP
jgi:hypothetical protein